MEQYIKKSAVVAEIERRRKLVSDPILSGDDLMIGERNALFNLLSFIDTLEVKEVDLEKEYDNEFFKDPVFGKLVNRNAGISIAKYFFELGLKYKDSYKQGYADAIEKACKLLARMIWEVTYEDLEGNSVQNKGKMEFIDKFKNYMKGE